MVADHRLLSSVMLVTRSDRFAGARRYEASLDIAIINDWLLT